MERIIRDLEQRAKLIGEDKHFCLVLPPRSSLKDR
jgi:hypothetical protein